jgi:natural product precursor
LLAELINQTPKFAKKRTCHIAVLISKLVICIKQIKTMKKLNTKLTLNKESVMNLNDDQMRNVIGGDAITSGCTLRATCNNPTVLTGPNCGPPSYICPVNFSLQGTKNPGQKTCTQFG